MLIHLPSEDGYGVIQRTKNGPAPAGYGAVRMKDALAATMTTLPELGVEVEGAAGSTVRHCC